MSSNFFFVRRFESEIRFEIRRSEIALKNLIRKLYSILIVSFRSVYTLSVFFFILLVFSFT